MKASSDPIQGDGDRVTPEETILRLVSGGGAFGPVGVDSGDSNGPNTMSDERLAKLEGAYDALKVVRPMTITVLSVLLAALVFVLSVYALQLSALNTKVETLNTKIDAIPQRLSDEFRAMRAEMAAQTSAIANSITAARQMQAPPPTPPNPAPKRQ
jgi:outer membrane murein-binding lipoprotein Lpp